MGLPVIDPSDSDYTALAVTDALLGGSFASRITMNIREDKGYTYSPSSYLWASYFFAPDSPDAIRWIAGAAEAIRAEGVRIVFLATSYNEAPLRKTMRDLNLKADLLILDREWLVKTAARYTFP